MRATYLGERATHNHGRAAVIEWEDHEDSTASDAIDRMIDRGWKYSMDGLFPLYDREEFEYFMEDWKEVRSEMRKERRSK